MKPIYWKTVLFTICLSSILLLSMKNGSETNQVEKKPLVVQEIQTPEMYALVSNFKCSAIANEISRYFGDTFAKLIAYIGKNDLVISGHPFSITNHIDENRADIDAGLPIDKMGKSDGDIKAIDMKAGNALKVTYKGAYSKIGPAYEFLGVYLKEHHKTATGKPYEVYITDPMAEPDTAKWVTEVYFPVK